MQRSVKEADCSLPKSPTYLIHVFTSSFQYSPTQKSAGPSSSSSLTVVVSSAPDSAFSRGIFLASRPTSATNEASRPHEMCFTASKRNPVMDKLYGHCRHLRDFREGTWCTDPQNLHRTRWTVLSANSSALYGTSCAMQATRTTATTMRILPSAGLC